MRTLLAIPLALAGLVAAAVVFFGGCLWLALIGIASWLTSEGELE